MEKKEKNYDLRWAIFETIFITITLLLMVIFVPYNKSEESKAYKNDIQLYSSEYELINTTWLWNSTGISSPYGGTTFNIEFTSNNQNFNYFIFQIRYGDYGIETKLYFDNILVYNNNNWTNKAYRTTTFTSSNSDRDLYYQVYNNATQLVTEEFYNISYNLQNVLVIGEKPSQISNLEEINIEFQNFNNYELPQNIMIENASYNWNYETGILTIYDATGNVEITIRAEYISGNYSFIELIDSVVLIPLNTFFNLFNFDIFGVNIYALLTATLTLFVIVKVLLKVFK